MARWEFTFPRDRLAERSLRWRGPVAVLVGRHEPRRREHRLAVSTGDLAKRLRRRISGITRGRRHESGEEEKEGRQLRHLNLPVRRGNGSVAILTPCRSSEKLQIRQSDQASSTLASRDIQTFTRSSFDHPLQRSLSPSAPRRHILTSCTPRRNSRFPPSLAERARSSRSRCWAASCHDR
jgi:hypothetical protein